MGEDTREVGEPAGAEPLALGVGYLRRLLGYAHKVYALGAVLERVRDGRPRPQIPMSTVVRAVFACGLFRVRSFNALEPQLGEPQLAYALGLGQGKRRGRVCSVDTLGRALRQAAPESFHEMLRALIERAERNKVFREGWIGAPAVCGARWVGADCVTPPALRAVFGAGSH